MFTFKDEKPLDFLTKKECQQLNVHATEKEQSIGAFSNQYKNYREFPIYDRTGVVEKLIFYKRKKDLPIGYITKATARNYQIPMLGTEEPVGYMIDEFGRGIIGIYNKSEDPTFIKYKEAMLEFEEEIQEKNLPVYDNKTRPENWFPICRMKGYILDPAKKPSGVYVSNKGKYWYLYDMSDEMDKPHFEYRDVPEGFLYKGEFSDYGLLFNEDEMPAAYSKRLGSNSVSPLYDRTRHPKFRIRIMMRMNLR